MTLPTKEAWTRPSTLGLIQRTAREAVHLANHYGFTAIYCPRLGCGLGGLAWKDVVSVLAGLWDDRFMIVHPVSYHDPPVSDELPHRDTPVSSTQNERQQCAMGGHRARPIR